MRANALVTIVPFLVLCSVQAIRVPIDWNSDSAVPNEKFTEEIEIIGETHIPASNSPIPIPVEYFQYPAKKPQFAVDVAKFHGVKNPENHYSAYPIHPYTGKEKPVLGKHQILDESNPVFHQFQQFTKVNENDESSVTPTSADYEVFHPYEAEEPALQEIYKDPVLEKIRNDIYNSQNRLQKYEKDAGEPDIQEGEYLESPEKTDRKKIPQKNIPVPYEIHRPQRRPVYYRPSPYSSRDRYLNHRFRHPWNQHNAKIRPVHYRPLKSHLQRLRQNHAIKYDDENNEYPQVPTHEQISELPEGYDIYERGKAKYHALRDNVDESINGAIKQNRPITHQRLELQNSGKNIDIPMKDDDHEFVPIKNYAQVRKFETTKHLPKQAALEDAVSYDEIKNAPRLKEAVKSTKAQTVYTEEGYEDAAYDHEGEEKHAAENEAHGGHLTEKQISAGKFKTPSVSQKYQDAGGNEYRDQLLHGEKWKDNEKDKEEEAENDDYSEDETAHSIEADVYDDVNGERDKRQDESKEIKQSSDEDQEPENEESENTEETVERSKREYKYENKTSVSGDKSNNTTPKHDVNKRETDFKIPQLNLSLTYLTEDELVKKAKIVTQPKKGNIKEKYPYYFRNLKNINRNSPLKYAENLQFIPKKSKGGSEFYESRSKIMECPEVDDDVDPIPDKLNKDGHPDKTDDSEETVEHSSGKADFNQLKKNRRLKGLGDKIDCFKAKFFGENPLDSPFFKEGDISNPEPVTAPNLPIYKITSNKLLSPATGINTVSNNSEKLLSHPDVFPLFKKLNSDQRSLQDSLAKSNQELITSSQLPLRNLSFVENARLAQQTNVYSDILENIRNKIRQPQIYGNPQIVKQTALPMTENNTNKSDIYLYYQNKEDITKVPPSLRKKRATPFIYEPYKIIRDGQLQESKTKTTTLSNISPLIKQLQASRVIDKVNKNLEENNQPVKRNVATRSYKDISRKDRVVLEDKGAKDTSGARFIDVSVDSRRGEPRYELRLTNHKTQYAPIENKKSMSLQDYVARTNKTIIGSKIPNEQLILTKSTTTRPQKRSTEKTRNKQATARPYFDVSQFLPKTTISDLQKPSASNTVRKIIMKPAASKNKKVDSEETDNSNDEDYEEYYDEESTTTTTTSTSTPLFRKRRPKITSTTSKLDEDETTVLPKLRLITRFNTTPNPTTITLEKIEPINEKTVIINHEDVPPKYREKKKKSSKSTLVTDTKSYGNGDEDMMKDEVDAMIGVQQDMEEYAPSYEKKMKGERPKSSDSSGSSEEDDSSDNDSNEDEHDDEEESYDDDDDDSSDSVEDEESNSSSAEIESEMTTPEPTKQTLPRTTEAPISTTETRSAKLQSKPIVHKTTIEIHKELPVNKSSPHTTQFKQDYKEVEIIKEMRPKPKSPQRDSSPYRILKKNTEALELYKDENLAKEVNKLGAVEVFKENLDLVKGPKHGGNYRNAKSADLDGPGTFQNSPRRRKLKTNHDVDTAQTENEKLIENIEVLPARRANGRNFNLRTRNNGARPELEEATDKSRIRLHHGNLKSIPQVDNKPKSRKNAELIELDEEETYDETTDDTSEEKSKTYYSPPSRGRHLHGGNYRSAKLINDDDETASIKEKATTNNHESKSAVLLNSFARAVPHLTTTPAYIVDPSKRMYYYVDAKR